jgi:hypothetical protein
VLVTIVVISTIAFVKAGNTVVYRWQPTVAATQRLLTDLVDQETGIRGYALSRDRAFLEPYNDFRTAQTKDTAHVRSLIAGDGELVPLLSALDAAAHTWATNVAEPAVQAIGAGDPAADSLVDGATAKRLFDAVRARAADLTEHVNARTRQARSTRTTAGTVFIVAISLAAFALLAAGVALWRGLHRWVLSPVDRLGGQIRQVAGGDTYKQIVPDGPIEFTGLGNDVEAMRLRIAGQLARAEEIHEELRLRGEELARSNDDLQQFAYVASHDLSEPLRKVANFCQLLERQYGPHLDDRARQYIDFAVDGAKRMQVLIADLLSLSRVGRTAEEFAPVELDRALDVALGTLADRLAEAGARVERGAVLPTVSGDRSLLTSLLENLIGNAVKYRRDGVAPVVRIGVEHDADEHAWTFAVRDNGIGIDPQYADRIFVVFQRLHLRDAYGGTGIGLALCRRIVEFHGGRIWLDTVESGPGATFRFILPEEGGPRAESRD